MVDALGTFFPQIFHPEQKADPALHLPAVRRWTTQVYRHDVRHGGNQGGGRQDAQRVLPQSGRPPEGENQS